MVFFVELAGRAGQVSSFNVQLGSVRFHKLTEHKKMNRAIIFKTGVLMGGLFLGVGCATNNYEKYFIPRVPLRENAAESAIELDIYRVPMTSHETEVSRLKTLGHEIIGVSEFNSSSFPSSKHLPKAAKKVGATVAVSSRKFDRREQKLENTREWIPGERITVNGVTVETEGRWVNQIEVRDYEYNDYKATFLRHEHLTPRP